jgi:hypothetical protein
MFACAAIAAGAIAQGCGGDTGDVGDSGTDAANEAAACSGGQTACGLGCADTSKDPDNCGACGKTCTGGQVCSQGACAMTCSGGTTQCGQSCVQTDVDPANCGSCGKACGAGEACVSGTCKTECVGSQTACTGDGGAYCASTSTDNANCGACGNACGAGQVCSAGKCTSSCGGGDAGTETFCTPDAGVPYCADTTADNANCGACGTACGNGSVCQGGQCLACQSVLLISTSPTAPAGLVSGIQAVSPAFCNVGYFDANTATPPIGLLTPYQALLVFDDNNLPYSDATGLGNVVATYFDGGGRVVVALFADGGYAIGGNFASKYLLITPAFVPQMADTYDGSNNAQDLDPQSPVLAGVNSIMGTTGWEGAQTVEHGGAAIAKWASGNVLAVTGTVTDANAKSRKRVDLNIQPSDIASGAWTGDGMRLLGNALLYQ